MRVLHLIPDLTMGGAEMLVVNLLLALDRDQWAPRVVSMFLSLIHISEPTRPY